MLYFANRCKKFKMPKPLIFKIIESAGLKYSLGWEIVANEDSEIIFIESCKIENLELLEKVTDKVKNINMGLFIAGYFDNRNLANYLISKGAENVKFQSIGKHYQKKYDSEFISIHNGTTTYFFIRKMANKGIMNNEFVFKLMHFCNHKNNDYLYPCSTCYEHIQEALYGAAEGGNIILVGYIIEMRIIKNFSKALYFSEKYGHREISELLINAGAKYPDFIVLNENDRLYEIYLYITK